MFQRMSFSTAVAVLFVYLFSLEPKNVPYNAEMAKSAAEGIAAVTDVYWEAETLARIARWESGLRRDVADCVVLGKQGERGIFQVKPRSESEKTDLCSSDLSKQARIALARVRESKKECERQGFRGADVLGVYTHGQCIRGNRLAAFRYGDGSKLHSLLE